MRKLPIYDATITDVNCGVFCVSLVSSPATEVDFMVFDEDKPIVKFAVDDKVERIVSGVIMLADTPIYRRTSDNFEYYIKFSKDTLKLMAEKMIFDGVGSNVNIQHENGSEVDGVNLVELFILNREKGIAPTYFNEVPDGSLIGSYKVHNEDVWAMIEAGEVLSFSLEGVFEMVDTKEQFNKIQNKLEMKIDKIKAMLRKMLAEFGEVATDKGVLIWNGDEDLKEGDSVHSVNENGEDVPVEDGEYTTEDKKIIIIKDGKVESITDPIAEIEEEEEEKPKEGEEPKKEEEEEEEPKEDEKDLKIKELEDVIKAKDEEIEALKVKIEELETKSSAKSAEEAFAEIEKEDKSLKGQMTKRGYRF